MSPQPHQDWAREAAAAAAPAAAVFLNFTLLLLDGRGKEEVSEYFRGWKEVM